MHRRKLIQSMAALAALPLAAPFARAAGQLVSVVIPPLRKPADAWRKLLSPMAYAVLFEEATERAFTSPLLNEHREGTFVCAACLLPLFDARTKFESGTGWPSFTRCIPGHCGFKVDHRLAFETRTEYHCVRCGGHQGHVFDDGPPPLGKRWCNNGVALQFVPHGQPLPAWRI
ncbi:MAG: peptide-methionine (R)-S-oxide reductase MsrB [Proteobacteria bacterium]|nr:peptide-methionine (R)-S-oxide reductase MsrB [Pseudomonadota bacterium]